MQHFAPQNYKLFFKYANLFTTILNFPPSFALRLPFVCPSLATCLHWKLIVTSS